MRSRSGQSVELLRCEAGVAAVDIGECEKAGHRLCRLVVSGKELLPSRRPQFDCLLEASNPALPEDLVMPLVDSEQRGVAIGSLDQCPCDIVVMLHHEAEDSVQMVEAVEGGFVFPLASPDDRQPFARFDQFGAYKEASDEAIEFLQQHRIIAESQKLMFKLLEIAGRFRHGLSISTAAVRRRDSPDDRRSERGRRLTKPADQRR